MQLMPELEPAWRALMFGAGGGGGFFAVKWFVEWVAGRIDKREVAVAAGEERVGAGYQALIDHLQGQITNQDTRYKGVISRMEAVELELEACREREARNMGEIAQLRGLMHGMGDARQQAANIVAAERLKDKKGEKE